MNKKGFMMAEVIVVSTIILGVLTSIYISYGKVFRGYSEIINYYDVEGIYDLAYYRDSMINTGTINSTLSTVNSNHYVRFGDGSSYPGLIIVKKDCFNNTNYFNDLKNLVTNQTYKDYLDYIKRTVDFNSNYIMVMEKEKNGKYYYNYLELEV